MYMPWRHKGGGSVQLHLFLISVPDVGGSLTSLHCRFTPRKELRHPGNWRLGGPQSGMDKIYFTNEFEQLFLGAFTRFRKATISFVMSLCVSVRLLACPSAWSNSALTERILMKFDISAFFENLWRKFKFYLNLTRITGTLHEDQYTFLIICRWFILRMRNVLNISCK